MRNAAYDRGYSADDHNKGLPDNPYTADSNDYASYIKGWWDRLYDDLFYDVALDT